MKCRGRKLTTRAGGERLLRHAFAHLRRMHKGTDTGPEFYGLASAMHEIRAAYSRVAPHKRPLKWGKAYE